MKMMFFCLILLSIAGIYNSAKLSSRPMDVDDSPFYDGEYFLKKMEIKKLKEEVQIKIADKLNLAKSKIRNFDNYIRKNKINFISGAHSIFNLTTKGNCNKILNLAEIYQSVNNYTSSFNYTENILNFQTQLNDKNTIFNDEYGNLIIFSFCSDLFSLKCQPKFFFLNKLNFEFYEFTLSGEKIPKLSGFALDYLLDKNLNNKKFIYLFGGIDNKGVHNSDLYRFDIDYSFGNIKIKRMGIDTINSSNKEQKNYVPVGVSENSLNVLSYTRQDRESYQSVISYGGINDESISNKLSVYNPIINTWSEINSVLKSNGIFLQKRKGHSSIIINEEEMKFPISLNRDSNNINTNINKSLMKIYYMIIFGGKSDLDYHNDIIIIKISYMILDDIFYYELLENNSDYSVDGDLPPPREGHKALLKDEYMYILGGCDYSKKKCYINKDMIYRLNIRTTPMLWEKVEYDLIDSQREEFSFDEKNLNLQYFNNEMINIGVCNNFSNCGNSIKILINDVKCKCRNVFIGERNDYIPFSNVFKSNDGSFNMTEAIEEWSGKVNLKTLIEIPTPKMNNLFCTEMSIKTLNKLKDNEYKKLENDLIIHFMKFNMTDKISFEDEKKPKQKKHHNHKNITDSQQVHNKSDIQQVHDHESLNNSTHHKHKKNNHTNLVNHTHHHNTTEQEHENQFSILEGISGAGVIISALNGKNSHDNNHGKVHGKFNKTKSKDKNHKHKHKNHKNKTIVNSNKTAQDHTLKNGVHSKYSNSSKIKNNSEKNGKQPGNGNVINLFESLNENSTSQFPSKFEPTGSHHHKKKKFWKSINKTKNIDSTADGIHSKEIKEPKKKSKKPKKHHNKTNRVRIYHKHQKIYKKKSEYEKINENEDRIKSDYHTIDNNKFLNLDIAEMINRALKINLEPILKENEKLRKSLLNDFEKKSSPIRILPSRLSFIQLTKNHSHHDKNHHKYNHTHTNTYDHLSIDSLFSNMPDHKNVTIPVEHLHKNKSLNNKTGENSLKIVKEYIKQVNSNSEKEIMSLLKAILKDVEYVKTNTTNKINELEKISKLKNDQVSTGTVSGSGSKVLIKCINGHLLK